VPNNVPTSWTAAVLCRFPAYRELSTQGTIRILRIWPLIEWALHSYPTRSAQLAKSLVHKPFGYLQLAIGYHWLRQSHAVINRQSDWKAAM
jgi:hypothetical protein